jgi:hypothetical protein
MGMPAQAPLHMNAPLGDPTFITAGLQTMGMPPPPCAPNTTGTAHVHNPFSRPGSSSSVPAYEHPPTPAHAPAPAPVVAHAPAPAPAPHPALVDGHSTAQWKNSSAFHEYHAKQLTVQVHELRASTEQLRTSMHEAVRAESESRVNNESLVAKEKRMQQVVAEKTVHASKLQLEATVQAQLLQAAEASRVSLQMHLDKANADKQLLENSCLRLMNTVEWVHAVSCKFTAKDFYYR